MEEREIEMAKNTQYENVRHKIDGMVATNEKYRLIVKADEDASSPREDDNVGKMICFHSRSKLGDNHEYRGPDEFALLLASTLADGWEDEGGSDEDLKKAWAIIEKNCVILPLFVYEHGGITMSTGKFSCPWDSGQVGWIYCTLEKGRKEWNNGDHPLGDKELVEKITKHLEAEVKTYDDFITGRCWRFELQIKASDMWHWETDDSCGGFIGDVKECGIEEHLPEDARELVKSLEWNS
jgi:hypothetical protein